VRTYTADLNGIRAEPGCVSKVPAKHVCVATTKTDVQPTPPGAESGAHAGRFLCYKLKCAKTALPTFPLADQFGTRAVTHASRSSSVRPPLRQRAVRRRRPPAP
jgi:hypothetical protein